MPDLTVNGGRYRVEAEVGRTLAETLREDLGLTGTKVACAEGHCGACTVMLDGLPVLSCITLVHVVGDREVTTIEGLRDHPLVDAFVAADALQCGFCTPGQIVSATALVRETPGASPDEIRHAMAGNLCRCGTYPRIEEAIRSVGDLTVPPRAASAREDRDGSTA
jgi:aerobic-type carbon monoxide dehydrogenase small subunit (CoxS/CutS family)